MRTRIVLATSAAALLAFAPLAIAQTQQPPPPDRACSLIAADTADLLRQVPLVAALVSRSGHTITDQQITDARTSLGCGPAPERTPAQAKAAVCDALNVAGLRQLLDETHPTAEVRALVDAVPEQLVTQALDAASRTLGCTSAVPLPTPTTKTPPPAGTGQVGQVPVGGVDTGDGSTL